MKTDVRSVRSSDERLNLLGSEFLLSCYGASAECMEHLIKRGGAIGHGIQLMGSACMGTWIYIFDDV